MLPSGLVPFGVGDVVVAVPVVAEVEVHEVVAGVVVRDAPVEGEVFADSSSLGWGSLASVLEVVSEGY